MKPLTPARRHNLARKAAASARASRDAATARRRMDAFVASGLDVNEYEWFARE